MKILQIGKYYYPHMGGIENHLQLLSEELVNLGNDVTVVASNDSPNSSYDIISGVKVHRYPMLMTILNAPIFMPFSLKEDDFDIVHVHLPNPLASLLALLNRTENLVVTYHSDIINNGILAKILIGFYAKFILHPLLKKAKIIIATSPNYVAGSEILQKYKNKVKSIPYSVDLNLFKMDKSNKKILEELKEKYAGKNVILFVGRLVPYKGLKFLINSMTEVAKKINNVKLLIIGDGILKYELKEYVVELGLNDWVEFIPGMANEKLPPYYSLSDIFILPSIYKSEAFGIVQLEAMACGKPVVSTNVFGSGISFANKNNVTGFIVEPENSSQLASTIIKMLENNKLRKFFGENAKIRVKKHFSKDVMVKSILGIYKSISKHH